MDRLTVKDKKKYQVGQDGTTGKYYLAKIEARVRITSKAYMKIPAIRKPKGTGKIVGA